MRVTFAQVEYLGGHPRRPQPTSVAEKRAQLVADDQGIHVRSLHGAIPSFTDLFMIPWSEMSQVSVEASEENTRLTLSTHTYACEFEIRRTQPAKVQGALAPWAHGLSGRKNEEP